MKPRVISQKRIGLTLVAVVIAAAAHAQTSPTYVQFSPAPVKGALYKPDSGPAPHVGIVLVHRTANFLSAPATRELSKRGFMVLAVNPRSDNNEAIVDFEANALDIKSAVEFLRKQPGITKVLLWGHSGGGPATSFYQAVAEQGTSYCNDPGKLSPCDESLAGLAKADGLILVDAHPGISVNGLRSLNPAVIDESDAKRLDRSLDPFNPANGFVDGRARYSDEFKARYFKAQADRMNRLIDAALSKLKAMRAGTAPYPDDDVMIVTRFEGARLMELDPTIHHATVKPQRLLKNDGTIVTQIVESVRRPATGYERRNATFSGGARVMTVRSFLSANAIRAKDSMDGIDWCSSNNSTRCAVAKIAAPTLIAAMGAHYFIRDSEIHYDASASRDKEFIVIEGATHGFTPCTACESVPGQYGNSFKNLFDYAAKWINARF
jgi:pimeloyl-ACP methyl ester carboxylesterase